MAMLMVGAPSWSGQATELGIAGKFLTIGVVTAVSSIFIGFFIGLIPTLAVTYAESITMGSTGAIPSLANYIENGWEAGMSAFANSSKAFFSFALEALPLSTLLFCAAHYGAFLLYGKRLAFFVNYVIIRLIPFVKLCVVGGLFLMSVQGAEVQILNLSGTNVTFVQGSTALVFPPGDITMNLEAGAWEVPGGELEIPNTEDRVYIRCDAVSSALSIGESDWSWFWAGFQTGLVTFGCVAMAAAIRRGLAVAVRVPTGD